MKNFKGTPFTWKALPSHSQQIDIVAGGGTVIATVKPRDLKGEAKANAKVMAASKELLEALELSNKWLIKILPMVSNSKDFTDALTYGIKRNNEVLNKAL